MSSGDVEDRKLIQRWIGAPQTGDLNDAATVAELLKDVTGLQAYLIAKEAPARPALATSREFGEVQHRTPNMGGTIKPLGVVWHHSAGSFAGTLDWIKQSRSQVSYHVVIDRSGARHNVVPLDRRAWHAGKSVFQGRRSCNGFMVGVAFSGSTYDRPLTDEEIASAVEFVAKHRERYGWTLETMTDHRQVSPGRKNDLNPVEWARLREAMKGAF